MLQKLKGEGLYLLIAVAAGIVLMKIAFYNESLMSVIRVVLSFFFVFVIPGYSIMLYWIDKLGFAERIIFGTVMGIAVIGASSYYLGLIGWNVNSQHIALPLMFIALGIALGWKRVNQKP